MDRRYYRNELLQEQHRRLRPNVAQLCRNIEISRTAYYDILAGNSVSPEMLEKLCPHLQLAYADVIRTEPADAPHEDSLVPA